MDKLIAGVLGVVVVVAVVLFFTTISTFFGAVGGWIVGLFFADTIMSALSAFGVDTSKLTMWQLGAFLGFIGGYLRAVQTNTNS